MEKSIREVAKELNIYPSTLQHLLVANHIAYFTVERHCKPYPKYVQNGSFKLKPYSRKGFIDERMMVTPKGENLIKELITTKGEVHNGK